MICFAVPVTLGICLGCCFQQECFLCSKRVEEFWQRGNAVALSYFNMSYIQKRITQNLKSRNLQLTKTNLI